MLHIFNIKIDDCNLGEIVEKIKAYIRSNQRTFVVTANPEILLRAHKNKQYHAIISRARLVCIDGAGVILASYLLGKPLKQGRVTGADLVEELAKQSEANDFTLYFVGYNDNVLQKATQNLKLKYPNCKIAGYAEGPFFNVNQTMPINNQDNNWLVNDIKAKKPDILLVGFGSPKQDYWLDYYLPLLPCKVGIGVGGSFDYFAGAIKRAPKAWQSLGLEWLYRLVKQPVRLRRIFNAVVVFPLVVIFYCLFSKVPRGTS
ncbi:MAG: WecB/TagA/CpsF family glycosyltransferase [Patescibacteria group bacterium]